MTATMPSSKPQIRHRQRVFRYLLLFRWASLLPVAIALLIPQTSPVQASHNLRALIIALSINAVLTLLSERFNRVLLRKPALLGIDLLISIAFLWYTGMEDSPYYLYSLTPILGAAFFFRIRGGLLAAAVYTLLYLFALFALPRQTIQSLDLTLAAGQIISSFIMGLVFGYMSILLEDIRRAHDELAISNEELTRRNRDLDLLQALTLLLQSSVDPVELQEYIVRGLVEELGYRRALIGLFDNERTALTAWLVMENFPHANSAELLPHTEMISLQNDQGTFARALRLRQVIEVLDGEPATGSRSYNKRLVQGKHYIVLPMALRENLLGIIVLDHLPAEQPLSPAERDSLETLAAHAGVALGSVRLCINRAQQEAVTEERNRIAIDLHDSISQVLYGLAYGLNACIQLLPDQAELVKGELQKLQPVVADAQAQMRTTIFDMRDDQIASDTFTARLHRHLGAICPAHTLVLRIELPGEFDLWQPEIRYVLYRIAQEAMTNASRHANASRIVVTIASHSQSIELRVEDDGMGFEPDAVDTMSHLGIQSMTERVHHIGGSLDIQSSTEGGTAVVVRIPQVEELVEI